MPGDGKLLNAVANLTFRKEEITFFYEKYAFNVLLETTQLLEKNSFNNQHSHLS